MNQQQRLKESKLAYGEICTPCSLHSFLACYSDTNMRFQYHRYIVGSVADRKCRVVWVLASHHLHNLSLLTG